MMQPAPISFQTAYNRLNAAERDFVDGFVSHLDQAAHRAGSDLRSALERLAQGGAVLDWRTAEFLALERVQLAIR